MVRSLVGSSALPQLPSIEMGGVEFDEQPTAVGQSLGGLATAETVETVELEVAFKREIGRHKLLSAAEEKELAKQIEAGSYAETLLALHDIVQARPNQNWTNSSIEDLLTCDQDDTIYRLYNGLLAQTDTSRKSNKKPTEQDVQDLETETVDAVQRDYTSEAQAVALAQVQELIAKVQTYDPVHLQELRQLVQAGKAAFETFLLSNLGLLFTRAAEKYWNNPHIRVSMGLMDLVNEGYIGLRKAVQGFDYTKGFKFSTYATWWIRQSIDRAMSNQGRSVRLPQHILTTLFSIYEARKALRTAGIAEPTDGQIAKQLGKEFTAVKVREYLDHNITAHPVSLATELDYEGEITLADMLANRDNQTPPDPATEQLARAVQTLLQSNAQEFADREIAIIRDRFGLDDGVYKNLDVVGKRFNLSRERIRQLERKVLAALRESPEWQHLNRRRPQP